MRLAAAVTLAIAIGCESLHTASLAPKAHDEQPRHPDTVGPDESASPVQALSTAGRNFYRLVSLGPDSFLGTTVDGRLSRMSVLSHPSSGGSLHFDWDRDLDGSFSFSLAAGELNGSQHRIAVVGGADGVVRAFDASSGTPLWSHHLAHAVYSLAILKPPPAVYAGTVVFAGTSNGTLAALDGSSGDEVARWPLQACTAKGCSTAAVRALVAGDFSGSNSGAASELFVGIIPDDTDQFYQTLRLSKSSESPPEVPPFLPAIPAPASQCPQKLKGMHLRHAEGAQLLKMYTQTPFSCCENCSGSAGDTAWTCAGWAFNGTTNICTLMSKTNETTKTGHEKDQCGHSHLHPSPPPGPPSPAPATRVFELLPLTEMWSKPVHSVGGRAGAKFNAVRLQLPGGDAVVSNVPGALLYPSRAIQFQGVFQEAFPSLEYANLYRMMIVATGRFTSATRQAAVAFGMDFSLHSLPNASLVLNSASRSNLSYTDVAVLEGDRYDSLVLSGGPNGDDSVYLVKPAADPAGWAEALAKQDWPSGGTIHAINQELDSMSSLAAVTASRKVPPGTPPVTINVEAYLKVGMLEHIPGVLHQLLERHRFYTTHFPYPDRIRFAVEFAFYENVSYWKRPDGQPWASGNAAGRTLNRTVLMDGLVRPLIAAKVPFIIRAGHGAGPYISPATASAVIATAGQYLVGFSTAEQHGGQDATRYYFENAIRPIMYTCAEVKPQCKVFFNEKNTFWASAAAGANSSASPVLDRALKYVSVPSAEDSNSRSPDLNFAARLGLLASGTVGDLKARLVSDTFSFNRAWDWSKVMVGHPHLRALTVQIALGARFVDLDCDQRFTVGSAGGPAGNSPPPPPVVNGVMRHGVAQLLELIGRGVIYAPASDDLLLPPVALVIENVSLRFLTTGTGGHDYRTNVWDGQDVAGDTFAFGRLRNMWGYAPTAPADVSTALWGRKVQFGAFIPDTHGIGSMVPVYPGVVTRESWGGAHQVFSTDGDFLRRLQQEPGSSTGHPIASNASELRAAAVAAGSSLPFQVVTQNAGPIFAQQLKNGAGGYILYLVSTGYTNPAANQSVTIRLSELAATTLGNSASVQVVDRVSTAIVGVIGRASSVAVVVPRGGLRIFDITVA